MKTLRLSVLISFFVACFGQESVVEKPNIIFVLVDDVGWSDFGYNSEQHLIPTPFLDDLALGPGGIAFKQHYAQSLCTPTRASLMTGRYSVNTGLTFVLMPGSPAGLPSHMETMAEAFKKRAGYKTAMSGKWHLGHAQHKMTPTGRGFDKFTGLYTWDADSYTKLTYTQIWRPTMVDWVVEHTNRSFEHFAEARHSTTAITTNAVEMMATHAEENNQLPTGERSPLFLYVPYTAAHSPLQPMPEHIAKCAHLPHLWRRQFCGMVVGLDEGVRNITAGALTHLGENTVLVVSSDNGGVPWFGGLNFPFRGTKTTPFEGGVRVPAFAVDFSPDKRYLGSLSSASPVTSGEEEKDSVESEGAALVHSHQSQSLPRRRNDTALLTTGLFQPHVAVNGQRGGRVFHGMMHICDWMPTLLSVAGVSQDNFPMGLDGINMHHALLDKPTDAAVGVVATHVDAVAASATIVTLAADGVDGVADANGITSNVITSASPRTEMLLELLTADATVFRADLMAYRMGDWKLIYGHARDPYWYSESSIDRLNTTDETYFSVIGESIIRSVELVVDPGPFDTTRIVMTHNIMQTLQQKYRSRKGCSDNDTSTDIDHNCDTIKLYNIATDPTELVNQADAHPELVRQLMSRIEWYREHRPPQPILAMQFHPMNVWPKTFLPGDCSMNPAIPASECHFTHPWVDDAVEDVYALPGLVDAIELSAVTLRQDFYMVLILMAMVLAAVVTPIIVSGYIFGWAWKSSQKSESGKEKKN